MDYVTNGENGIIMYSAIDYPFDENGMALEPLPSTYSSLSAVATATATAIELISNESCYGDNCAHKDPRVIAQWWVGILELFIFAIGSPANLIVLHLALLKRKNSYIQAGRKRNITRYLVISMTTADLLFCLIHSPMMFVVYNVDSFEFGKVPCLTLFAVTHFSTVASSLSLMLININKFLQLRRPLHYVLYATTYRGIFSVLVCWLISMAWSILFISGLFMESTPQCDVFVTNKNVYVLFAVAFFVVPTLISLLISVYVALVVFDARGSVKESREKCALQSDVHSWYSSFQTPNSIRPKQSVCSVSSRKNPSVNSNCANGHATETTGFETPVQSYGGTLLTLPSFRAKRSSSFTHADMIAIPKYSRQISVRQRTLQSNHRFRRIGFVFTTTVWSTLTVLPYRLAFIAFNASSTTNSNTTNATAYVSREEIHEEGVIDRTAETAYMCLFALMALNAAGNPFITIMTQRQYSMKLVRIWGRLWEKRNSFKRMVKTGEHTSIHFGNSSVFGKTRRLSL